MMMIFWDEDLATIRIRLSNGSLPSNVTPRISSWSYWRSKWGNSSGLDCLNSECPAKKLIKSRLVQQSDTVTIWERLDTRFLRYHVLKLRACDVIYSFSSSRWSHPGSRSLICVKNSLLRHKPSILGWDISKSDCPIVLKLFSVSLFCSYLHYNKQYFGGTLGLSVSFTCQTALPTLSYISCKRN